MTPNLYYTEPSPLTLGPTITQITQPQKDQNKIIGNEEVHAITNEEESKLIKNILLI